MSARGLADTVRSQSALAAAVRELDWSACENVIRRHHHHADRVEPRHCNPRIVEIRLNASSANSDFGV